MKTQGHRSFREDVNEKTYQSTRRQPTSHSITTVRNTKILDKIFWTKKKKNYKNNKLNPGCIAKILFIY